MADGEASGPGNASPGPHPTLRQRWEERDPGLRATKRSVRAAVLVPGVFALSTFGIGNSQTTLFAVFGSFALLLFADFGGSTSVRLRSLIGLYLAGVVLITAGTLCSSHAATAVIGMAVFGFLVLFAGAVSPQAAVGSTAALLTFVLPVAVPVGDSAIGSRLGGWTLAAAFCIPAVMLVWSGRWHDPLRRAAATAARAVAELVEAHAEGHADPGARARADDALGRLRAQYEATPYRPAGAGPSDSALVRLVSRMEWVAKSALIPQEAWSSLTADGPEAELNAAVASVLHEVADLMERDDALLTAAAVDALGAGVDRMDAARRASREAAWGRLLAGGGGDAAPPPAADGDGPSLWSVDPSYPIRMLAVTTEMTAEVALASVPRQLRTGRSASWRQAAAGWARSARARLTFRSVWFRNSVRGALALAMAVVVVEATDVQHGFWVVLGTLSVLRSNALGTGANALRAVAGTVVGFVIGSLILLALGHHLSLLWVVLPFAVLLAGVAPSAISFAAGQAGFTVAVVIIFNILDPVGVKVGLVRVEDVAIGVAVSTVVGLLFWPRGAGTELARSLSEAYSGALAWLVAEIETPDPSPAVADEAAFARAEGAGHRLDDAFRQFLAERGAKPVGLPEVTHLVTGSAEVRLVARTLAALPEPPVPPGTTPSASIARARNDVTAAFLDVRRWFDGCTEALGGRPVRLPAVEPVGESLRPGLLAAVAEARRAGHGDALVVSMRLLWLSDRLADLRAVQAEMAEVSRRIHR